MSLSEDTKDQPVIIGKEEKLRQQMKEFVIFMSLFLWIFFVVTTLGIGFLFAPVFVIPYFLFYLDTLYYKSLFNNIEILSERIFFIHKIIVIIRAIFYISFAFCFTNQILIKGILFPIIINLILIFIDRKIIKYL